MIYFIYKHDLNNKSYIGYTKLTIEKRLKQHINAKNDKKVRYFTNAIKKYGADKIISTCLETIETEDVNLVKNREIYWINFYDTMNSGYNLTIGGDGGNTWTANRNKDSTRSKLSKAGTGRKHTEEAKIKMREAAKSRPKQSKEALQRAEAKRKVKRDTGCYISEIGIEKLRELGKQKKFSKSYRKKLSVAAYNRETVICPHCKKVGIKNSMMRWHFNKCKNYHKV